MLQIKKNETKHIKYLDQFKQNVENYLINQKVHCIKHKNYFPNLKVFTQNMKICSANRIKSRKN